MSFRDWLIETLKIIIVERDERILELEKENLELRYEIERDNPWVYEEDIEGHENIYDYNFERIQAELDKQIADQYDKYISKTFNNN